MNAFSMQADLVPIGVVAVVGLIAAVIDIRIYKVHNLITVPLAVTGVLYHLGNAGLTGMGFSLMGMFVGFASLIVFYALGGVGAGDVKLLAGIGAWLGGWLTVSVLVIAGLAAGAYSLALLLCCGGVRHVSTNFSVLIYRLRVMAIHFGQDERVETVVASAGDRRRRLVPFAAMVLMGIVGVIFGANTLLFP
jgi:prepilin peptidase CpaA